MNRGFAGKLVVNCGRDATLFFTEIREKRQSKAAPVPLSAWIAESCRQLLFSRKTTPYVPIAGVRQQRHTIIPPGGNSAGPHLFVP